MVAGKVIGKKGNTIQGIMEKSRVLNVKIMGDDEAKKKNVDTKDKVSPGRFTNCCDIKVNTVGTVCVYWPQELCRKCQANA